MEDERQSGFTTEHGKATKRCPFCMEVIHLYATKCIRCGEYLDRDRFGFKHKTLWDVFGMLIVPITLVALGSLFALYQGNLERERAIIAAETSLLEQYLNDMSRIFLEEDLGDDNVRAVIRARTVAVVNELDSPRNAIVMGFLGEADAEEWVFIRTDIAESRLARLDLSGFNFTGANLTEANLSEANLVESNFTLADLTGANLSRAELYKARLFGSNLTDTNLKEAMLFGATISMTLANRTNLSGATLSEADLSDSDMTGADLSEANLSGANLLGTNLTESNLRGAYFGEEDVTVISSTGPSLTPVFTTRTRPGARYNRETKWPNGFDPVRAGVVLDE